jgi:hypothetical protein
MLESAAWRGLGINARKLIDRLLMEHRAHGGYENGKLKCPHTDLILYGLSRNKVTEAIEEAVAFGFVRVIQGGRYATGREPNLYRLTFYGDHEGGYPTNEWKGVTEDMVRAWKRQRQLEGSKSRQRRQAKAARTPKTGNGSPPVVGVIRREGAR